MSKVISVFGSSAPKPSEPAYQQAYAVGKLLAQAGFTVATGGYGGTMAGVSQGAAEANGHVIGITSTQIERYRPLGPNQWVAEEVKYDSLRERLLHLITHNDGMITLPGGIGTISEMTLAWSFLQVGEIEKRPFSLLGNIWHSTVHTFFDPAYVKQKDMSLLHFAKTPQEAVARMSITSP